MKAIAVAPGKPGLHLVDRPEPKVSAPDEVMLQVLQVGICGTDREETAGGRARAPQGHRDLVIGHEMLGRVLEVGSAVKRVKPGDHAIFTVRRGCNECLPCTMNRSDMCLTGKYKERGIWGLDGYQTERVVDREQYVVRVPAELAGFAVLCEPMTIVEKAIDEAVRVQMARLPEAAAQPEWLPGRRCLVAGLGPVGLLAALVLRLRGAEVYGLDVVDESSARPRWLERIGGTYVDGRQVPADQVPDRLGAIDLIVEAAGVARLEFNLIKALGLNGAYVLTGIPADPRPLQIPGSELISQLVLGNQVMIGSVNAARGHFQMAIDDLERAYLRWGDHLGKLITSRHASSDFEEPLCHHASSEIKSVIEWAPVDSSADTDSDPGVHPAKRAGVEQPTSPVPTHKTAKR